MKKEHVALVKRACRICYATVDAEILLAREYNTDGTPIHDVGQYHGKTIGYIEGTNKCDKCIEDTKGYMSLLVVDPDKTKDGEPYLTGDLIKVALTSVFAKDLIENHKDKILGDNIMYIDIETANQIKQIADGVQ